MKKILILFILFLFASCISASAEDITFRVTPAKLITTAHKNSLSEGDVVYFKTLDSAGDLKKGDIITGTVLSYEENGFAGKYAKVVLGNFQGKNMRINGKISVLGNEHYNKNFSEYVRGGEVILKPLIGEYELTLQTHLSGTSAKKIPLKIQPAQNISTTNDETQVGDILRFQVIEDCYYNNKILVKKGTYVNGKVGHFNENGWTGDNAKLQLYNFQTKDVNGKIVNIKSEVLLNGFDLLKTKGNRKAQPINYLGTIVRGKEIDIKYGVDKPVFTIWIEI